MDKQKRKELMEQYKQIKTYMGVIQMKNNVNGKIYLDAYSNLKNKWLHIQNQLNMCSHQNSQLENDWKIFGADAFTYEVLEQKDTEDMTDIQWELQQMKKTWMKKLQPYGENGYNKPLNE